MSTVTINIPDHIKLEEFDIQMLLASKWYEEGMLSSGQAAEMVGLSKRAFIELLSKYGVSVFGYDAAEVEKDLENA